MHTHYKQKQKFEGKFRIQVVMRCRQIDGGGISDHFERFFNFLIWKSMSQEQLMGMWWKINLLANDRNNNHEILSSNKKVIGFGKGLP